MNFPGKYNLASISGGAKKYILPLFFILSFSGSNHNLNIKQDGFMHYDWLKFKEMNIPYDKIHILMQNVDKPISKKNSGKFDYALYPSTDGSNAEVECFIIEIDGISLYIANLLGFSSVYYGFYDKDLVVKSVSKDCIISNSGVVINPRQISILSEELGLSFDSLFKAICAQEFAHGLFKVNDAKSEIPSLLVGSDEYTKYRLLRPIYYTLFSSETTDPLKGGYDEMDYYYKLTLEKTTRDLGISISNEKINKIKTKFRNNFPKVGCQLLSQKDFYDFCIVSFPEYFEHNFLSTFCGNYISIVGESSISQYPRIQ